MSFSRQRRTALMPTHKLRPPGARASEVAAGQMPAPQSALSQADRRAGSGYPEVCQVARRCQIAPAAGEHESHGGNRHLQIGPSWRSRCPTAWSAGYVQYRQESIDLAQSHAGTEQLTPPPSVATPGPAYGNPAACLRCVPLAVFCGDPAMLMALTPWKGGAGDGEQHQNAHGRCGAG
jgi:hypothetical protein